MRVVTIPVLAVLLAIAAAEDAPELDVPALETLHESGAVPERDEPALVRALAGEDGDVRFWAARVYAAVGASSPAGRAALVRLLRDPDRHVRRRAAETLGAVGAGDARAVRGLIDALGDPCRSVRDAAAAALVALGPSTLGAVAISLPRQSELGLVHAIYVLGRFAPDSLELADRIHEVAMESGEAVSVEAADVLRILLVDDDRLDEVERRAARLERVRLDREAALRDARYWLRLASAGRRGPRVEPGHPPGVLDAILVILRVFRDPATLALLASAVEAERARAEVFALAERLGAVEDDLQPLEIAVTGPLPGVRAAAARALAHVRDPRVLGLLHRALADEDPRVRRAARRSLDRVLGLRVGGLR